MGKQSKRKSTAPPAKAAKQQQLEQLPLLKKPLELVGTQIKVPGSYWQGRMSAAEKEALYVCSIRDFSALHTFPDESKGQGFQLQEMGESGTGSLEHGDASGDIFWMQYPFPMLTYYYSTYPERKPQVVDMTASPAAAGGKQKAILLDDDKPDSPPDVHPDFPHLRLSRAPVMEYFGIKSDLLQEAGPKSGMFAAKFECLVVEADGRQCCKERTIYHKKCRAVSTTNLINHIRERAAVCAIHKAALAKIEASSTNFIEIDGETVSVYNFNESFKCASPLLSNSHTPRTARRDSLTLSHVCPSMKISLVSSMLFSFLQTLKTAPLPPPSGTTLTSCGFVALVSLST